MVLVNNKRLSRHILLIQPADPEYSLPTLCCRVWVFDSAIKARQFAQEEGLVIPAHNLVIRFVGNAESERLFVSINALEQIDAFMDEAADWLAKNWRSK